MEAGGPELLKLGQLYKQITAADGRFAEDTWPSRPRH